MASGLGLHCLSMSHEKDIGLKWVKISINVLASEPLRCYTSGKHIILEGPVLINAVTVIYASVTRLVQWSVVSDTPD